MGRKRSENLFLVLWCEWNGYLIYQIEVYNVIDSDESTTIGKKDAI